MAEYDYLNNLTRRYVHGNGADQPLVWYEGSTVGASNRRHLFTNWQGSIAAITDDVGAAININAYDSWGIPDADNIGRFQYTGQIWIPELGLYHYKARAYSPTLGRFMQTDPIGYEDQYNLYAYVGNDPMGNVDPTGLCTGSRIVNDDGTCASTGGFTTGINGALQGMIIGNRIQTLTNVSGGLPVLQNFYGRRANAIYRSYDPENPVGDDGRLSLDEANEHYRNGKGADVTVDGTKLTARLSGRTFSNGSLEAKIEGISDWVVHGTVEIDPDTGTILPNEYDFRHNSGTGLGARARNAAATIGEIVATRGYTAPGESFMIHFDGKPTLLQPTKPQVPECRSCP